MAPRQPLNQHGAPDIFIPPSFMRYGTTCPVHSCGLAPTSKAHLEESHNLPPGSHPSNMRAQLISHLVEAKAHTWQCPLSNRYAL